MSKKFDNEFKRNAVRLVLENKVPLKRASKDLGIGKSTLEKWVRETKDHGISAFSDKSKVKLEDERLRKLTRENEVLRRERDILKKALAIFSLP